jgi:endonuclease/exonuclease/phosphatase family metal-dependent hydrolase
VSELLRSQALANDASADRPEALVASPRRWRLATLNMLKGGGRRVVPEQVLRDTRADLLLLQEAAGFSGAATARVWQPVVARGWGSGIQVAHGRLRPIGVNGFEGWVAGARWCSPLEDDVAVFSVHAPHGDGGYCGRMHRILDAIADAARAAGSADIIVGGDFNICISARGRDGRPVRARERAVQARLRDEFGLVNVWDALHPRRQPVQTLRWTGDPTVPYHCDGLFVPQRWSTSLRSCVVLVSQRWCERSDHNPVVATFTH